MGCFDGGQSDGRAAEIGNMCSNHETGVAVRGGCDSRRFIEHRILVIKRVQFCCLAGQQNRTLLLYASGGVISTTSIWQEVEPLLTTDLLVFGPQ